jgi:hypothetical protein
MTARRMQESKKLHYGQDEPKNRIPDTSNKSSLNCTSGRQAQEKKTRLLEHYTRRGRCPMPYGVCFCWGHMVHSNTPGTGAHSIANVTIDEAYHSATIPHNAGCIPGDYAHRAGTVSGVSHAFSILQGFPGTTDAVRTDLCKNNGGN